MSPASDLGTVLALLHRFTTFGADASRVAGQVVPAPLAVAGREMATVTPPNDGSEKSDEYEGCVRSTNRIYEFRSCGRKMAA
jgi:hypothetical protein